MFALKSKRIFAIPFVVGCLAAVYVALGGIPGQQEPVEGAVRLAETVSNSVPDTPEIPEVKRKKEPADLSMTASYYGYALEGLPTASGEPFDPEKHTAAHKSLPLGTELLVRRGDESVRVVVNDRGPYVAGLDLDLSQGAAEEIGLVGPGEDQVEVVKL